MPAELVKIWISEPSLEILIFYNQSASLTSNLGDLDGNGSSTML